MTTATSNRIEKHVVLKAPPSRVWQALSNAEEFGQWFGVDYAGKRFAPGEETAGKITHPEYQHMTMEVTVERMEPERLFSFRWRPYAVDPDKDYSAEPMTLIEFRLVPEGTGTRLTVTETGFDGIPKERRDEAFRSNEEGWGFQMESIRKHVDG